MKSNTKEPEEEVQPNGDDFEKEQSDELINENLEQEQLSNAEVDNEKLDNEQLEDEKQSPESPPNKKPIMNPNKGLGNLAENIAKEATKIAERMITKNERVAREFSGVGVRVQEETNNTEEAEEEVNNANYVYVDECPNGSEGSPNHKNKKKMLFGAKAIIPMNNTELMEKLKQRRN